MSSNVMRRSFGMNESRNATPADRLAVPYLLIANIYVQLIEDSGPGWFHLAVL